MIDRLIQFVIAVVVMALLAWFMSWAMTALGVRPELQTVAWVVFGLIVIVAVVGLFGYGPLKGPWRNEP